jgi:hypothetical protein
METIDVLSNQADVFGVLPLLCRDFARLPKERANGQQARQRQRKTEP